MNGDDDDLFSDWWKHGSRQEQIFRRFVEFHKANPEVWRLFKRFAFETISRGFQHYSSYAVFERIRWHVNIETRTFDGLKLNNDFRPYYSRLFEVAHPEHNGFFF